MSFLIGCGSIVAKKGLEVKSFDTDTFLSEIDIRKEIGNSNELSVILPPLLVDKAGTPESVGVIEIKINPFVFYVRIMTKNTEDRWGKYMFLSNIEEAPEKGFAPSANKEAPYPRDIWVRGEGTYCPLSLYFGKLSRNSYGVKIVLENGALPYFSGVHIGKSRKYKEEAALVPLIQRYPSTKTLAYSKEYICTNFANDQAFTFYAPYKLLSDGNGFSFGADVYAYNYGRLFSNNPKALSIIPSIDRATKKASYQAPDGMSVEQDMKGPILAGVALEDTGGYSFTKVLPIDADKSTFMRVRYDLVTMYGNQLFATVFVALGKKLRDINDIDINFVFFKRKE